MKEDREKHVRIVTDKIQNISVVAVYLELFWSRKSQEYIKLSDRLFMIILILILKNSIAFKTALLLLIYSVQSPQH